MKTKILVLFIFCKCIFSIAAEAQTFEWAKQFTTAYNAPAPPATYSPRSGGSNVVTDNNLNVISAGSFTDSVDLDPGPGAHWVYQSPPLYGSYHYLSKLDQNGSFVWGYFYDDGLQPYAYTRIYEIDVDNQDNIIVMGGFRDSVDLDFGPGVFKLYDPYASNNNSYDDNIFIAKYDPSGNLIWGKGLHSSMTPSSNSFYGIWTHGLKVDANNDVVLSGHFRDTMDFDPGPGVYNLVANFVSNTNYGKEFLLKLSSAGNFIWARDWNQTGNWHNNANFYARNELDVDANNNIFFTVLFTDSFDADPLTPISMAYSNDSVDVSLLKISPAGSMLWHKEIGGPSQDLCNSLATDPSGNIFYSIQLHGVTPVDMDPGPGVFMMSWPNSSWAKVILKLDNNGNFIWALRNIDNTITGWPGGMIATDTAGSVYFATGIHSSWNSNSFDLDPGPNAYLVSSSGSYDMVFQNLDGNGNFIWGGVIGGPGSNDGTSDIYTDNGSGVYLTGRFFQQADFDPTPDTSYMTSTSFINDAFVVKLNNCNVAKSTIYQACDSVVYNSQVFYNDTIIQNHYPAWNGCDSAHAIVIDVKTHTNDTIVVDTCISYLWNSTNYTSSGVYTHNYSLPNGCDSTVTLNLTINNSSTNTISQTGCDSLTINGQTYTSSGTYSQLFTNSQGCDSILSLNLTINNTTTNTISQTGCDSLMINAQTYTSSGTYTQLFTNATGCDSIVTLNLTINNSSTNTISQTGCDSLTINGQTYTSSGTYSQLFTNSQGCDSILSLNLTINNTTTNTISQTGCDSLTINGQTYTSSGTYSQLFTNSQGCDSILSLNLTINNTTTNTITQTGCDSLTINAQTYTSSGTYTQLFTNATGCDSIVTLVLTLSPSSSQNISLSDCDSASFNGISYSNTGQYMQAFTNIYGCDSNYIVNFTKTAVDTSITITGGASLVANATGASYQWIDCKTMMPIAGETNVFFNAPQTGSYACIITKNGCIDTSNCYSMEVWPNTVQEYELLSKIYPNPSKGSYHLQLDKEYKNVQLEVRSMSGQLVWKQDYKKLKETDVNINNAAGVYMLYIKHGERTQVKKLLKW